MSLLLLFLVCGTSSFGQENVVQISLSSYSVRDVAFDENVHTRSLGIPNVLVGERVYLNAETSGLEVAEVHWSLQPQTESRARLSGSAGRSVTFVADVEGQYDVRLRVTTPGKQVHEARLWVNVGRYVGTGSIVDSGDGAQCVNCHDQLVESWQRTGHATIFQRGIDGLFDRYDESCLECHAVGYREDVQAEPWRQETWTIPEALHEGLFDTLVEKHPKIANLTNVQCESCHGPGGEHMGGIDKNQIVTSARSEQCGYCHEFSSKSSVYSQYLGSAHVLTMDTPKERIDMNRKSCAPCHTTRGYWQVVLGGGQSDAPYSEPVGIVCVTCHDPHLGKDNAYMLRTENVEKACGCHDRVFRNEPDNFSICPQGSIVKGTGGKEFDDRTYPSGTHATVERNCAGCHMAEANDQALADRVGGHTFKVATKGDSPTFLNTRGCLHCHESMSLERMRESQAKTQALMDTLVGLLPKRADSEEPKFPADPTLSKAESMAAFNYHMVLQDGTLGVHNPLYVRQLLQDSIEDLIRSNQ